MYYEPYNPITKTIYQGANVVRLYDGAMKLNALHEKRWCTFLQAKQLGGNVKKGSKGVKLVYVNPDGTVKIENEEQVKKTTTIKGFTVFNFTQIEWNKKDETQ